MRTGTSTEGGRASSRAGALQLAKGAGFLLSLGMRLDRGRLVRAMAGMWAGYLAAPFSALALAAFTNDALGHSSGAHYYPPRPGAALALAAVVAGLLVAQLMLSHFPFMDYFELAEMQYAHLEGELIEVVNKPTTVEHLDSPVFADDLQLVREGLLRNTQALEAVLYVVGLFLQTGVTVVLLVRLNPWLVLLPLMALPPVWAGNKAQAVLEKAREACAEAMRLNRHFLELSTNAASAQELRLFGTEHEVLDRQSAAWEKVTAVLWKGQARSAVLRAAGQVFFAVAYGAAILAVVRQAGFGHGNIGDLVLVITLAVQVSTQVSSALSLLALLQSAAHMACRMESLRAAAITGGKKQSPGTQCNGGAGAGRTAPAVPPHRLEQGIVLEDVSFTYPGGRAPVLDRVSLELPAGQAIALVGENGAGKSTLVKLLCGMYTPTSGRILVDGTDLAELDPSLWRARTTALFQDFYRIELRLRESTGLGAPEDIGNDERVRRALAEARAETVTARLPGGLDGYVGRRYEDGMDLSGGQWQTVALSRSLMRDDPLLLVLDEPAAALDASAEHAIFERYASSVLSAAGATGGVTVLISHRFSTVLMAGSIAVLDKGRLVEHGPHRQLMASGGLYSELFQLQQRAYQHSRS
jgi:ATP-binding cassette subfamily B protein